MIKQQNNITNNVIKEDRIDKAEKADKFEKNEKNDKEQDFLDRKLAMFSIDRNFAIDDQWKIKRHLGKGGFGEVFYAKSSENGTRCAIKIEKNIITGSYGLDNEIRCLKKFQSSPYVARLFSYGKYKSFKYIIMELMGDDLHHLRLSKSNKRFGYNFTSNLGTQMLAAIESIHKLGYIHRDIKPSNFILKNTDELKVMIIDFGNSIKHLDSDGTPFPKQNDVSFAGTTRYASPHILLRKSPSRRDDLWSLLLSLVELITGTLPWPKCDDKNKIKISILNIFKTRPHIIIEDLPKPFEYMIRYLCTLRYKDEPNYELFNELIVDIADY
jgi:serine/threonine protein kinase